MKKIFKQDFVSTKETNQAKEKIKRLVSESFSDESVSTFERIHLNRKLSTSLWIMMLLLIISISLSADFGIYPLLFVSVFLLVMDIFWLLVCSLTRNSFRNKVRMKATKNHLEIFKTWFSENYEDVSIDEQIDIEKMVDTAMAHPGVNVDPDYSIWKVAPGYTVKGHDGISIQSMTVNWGAVKSTVKGNNFEIKKAYFAVRGIKDVFKENDFMMNQSKTSSKDKTNLENIEFNKRWSVYSKDEAKARMILTPSVQEDVLKVVRELDFQIERVDDFFWFSFNINHFDSTFMLELPAKIINLSSRDEIVENLIEVALKDVETFQNWLKTIVVFRTLFRTI